MATGQLGPQTLVVPCANQRQHPQPKQQEIQIAVSLAQLQHADQQVSVTKS